MDEKVFLYHAHGYALGGRIKQPVEQEINSHAATTLAVVGGYASSKTDNYQLEDLISYRSAHTYISGIENDGGIHSTVVDTVVEGLNILDVVTADAVIGRLTATHENGKPTKVVPIGSSFDNLKIAGKPVEVEFIDDLYVQHSTYDELLNHFQTRRKGDEAYSKYAPHENIRYQWGHENGGITDALKRHLLAPLDTGWKQSGDSIYSSIVRHVWELTPTRKERRHLPYGHAIDIPQVGRLYLGELTRSHHTKRLTMMRLELGSPVVGRLAVAGPETNGKWYP